MCGQKNKNMIKRYKFLKKNLKSERRDCKWKLGEWQHYKGKLKMCKAGFHCSKTKYHAFSYVQGAILAEVEVKGKSIKEKDKECWSDMRIIRAWKWQKKDSIALAIFSAELCLDNFEKVYPDDKRPREAIEAAKKYLDNPTEENRSAAWSAAQSAVWSAAQSAEGAAQSAARSARSAAQSAAQSVAQSAAQSAAWSAESAAWSAVASAAQSAQSAQSAAWSAAQSAAQSAQSAQSAAWSAAWSAARSAIIKKICKWFDSIKLDDYK